MSSIRSSSADDIERPSDNLNPEECRAQIEQLLSHALPLLCRSKLSASFSVEALIGITLDTKDVILVSVKERMVGDETESENATSKDTACENTAFRARKRKSGADDCGEGSSARKIIKEEVDTTVDNEEVICEPNDENIQSKENNSEESPKSGDRKTTDVTQPASADTCKDISKLDSPSAAYSVDIKTEADDIDSSCDFNASFDSNYIKLNTFDDSTDDNDQDASPSSESFSHTEHPTNRGGTESIKTSSTESIQVTSVPVPEVKVEPDVTALFATMNKNQKQALVALAEKEAISVKNSLPPSKFSKEKRVHQLVCDDCGMVYKSLEGLRSHKIRIHQKGKFKYSCAKCPRQFLSKTMYDAHVLGHENIKAYECNHCEKKFSLKHSLIEHVSSKHCDKKYYCDTCGKVFCYQKSLNMHIKTVHENSSHECPVCKAKFSYKCSLNRHMKTAHKHCTVVKIAK